MKTFLETVSILNLNVIIEHNDDSADTYGSWAILDENNEEDLALIKRMKIDAKYITASITDNNGALIYQGRGKDGKEAIRNLFNEISDRLLALSTIYAYDIMFDPMNNQPF